jgi:tricorn protease
MSPDSRAIVAFIGAGVLLVGAAVAAVRLGPQPPSPVASLPVAPVAAGSPPSLGPAPAAASKPSPAPSARLLLQHPSLSATAIAFDYAGEIWTVPRAGGGARRLVTGQLRNSRPVFSPDGKTIAFTGTYDGNADVYLVPAEGGEPRRLTHHPSADEAVAFTPDGARVLLRSMRSTPRDLPQLFTVPTAGGLPEPLPLPSGNDASFSPDGARLAFTPFPQWQPEWKQYHGGQTSYVWIADLADSHVVKVPHVDANDRYPMWVGDAVYFLSDRNGGTQGLFAYDTRSGAVREVARDERGVDIHFASAGPGGIVCERLDGLFLYDLAAGTLRKVPVTIAGELPQVRPHFERITQDAMLNVAVSPTGKRVLIEAHGEILSLPAEKGDVRNLTRSPSVADRDPAWSPDGKWVAWLSDGGGEYALYFRSPDGLGDVRKVDLGGPSFFYGPRWAPDSKKLLLSDKHLNLWLVDIEHPTPVKIDENPFAGASFDAAWSSDSRWIAYDKQLANQLRATFIYSVADRKTHQITDGRSDTSCPRFDRSGKYLWFLARTDVGTGNSEGMTSLGRPTASSVYAVVLQKSQRSPVAPQSDEEPDAGVFAAVAAPGDKDEPENAQGASHGEGSSGPDAKGGPKLSPVTIDFEAIDQRIVALPIDRANYVDMQAGAEGTLFLLAAPVALADEDLIESGEEPPPIDVWRFDLKKRKSERFLEKIDGGEHEVFQLTANGKKALYRKGRKLLFASADHSPGGGGGGGSESEKAGQGEDDESGESGGKGRAGDTEKAVDTAGLEVWVDPRAEWRQIYHEVWRVERDFLYDPRAHGLDLDAAEKLYAPWLDGLGGRGDLNALVSQALSNLVLGHVWMSGGALPSQAHVNVGLLGADFSIEQGRYRIAHILPGENWNPGLRAPLTEPGVLVHEGDFLLAVDGREVKGTDEIYRFFLGKAGKQTVLEVGARADGFGSRAVVVVPTASESSLRLRTWMEHNRRTVQSLSEGKVGYVFVPDTALEGYASFNRYYFSELSKQAMVVDERFNHGGAIADYIVNILGLTPTMMNSERDGLDTADPKGIFGPKVMIANQMSGSGGDGLPWLYKHAAIGPLVGVRTWGGWVGIGGYPKLIDGGRITAPRDAGYDFEGRWVIENQGVAPDVEVEQDPALVRQGHDPQLERAVQLALDALAKKPPPVAHRPPYPDYGKRLPTFAEP